MNEKLLDIIDRFRDCDTGPEFYQSAEIDLPFKSFVVHGIGPVGLPISLNQVEALKGISAPAPFGKGFDTVYDPTVRNVLQIDSGQIQLENSTFHTIMKTLLEKMQINVETVDVQCHLYKLLLYETGSHFVKHRDTEKEEGMFATMIVQLPVEGGYSGGKLVVEHDHDDVEVDLSQGSDSKSFAVVFYADCEHCLEEVTSGYRIALVFNLIWSKLPENSLEMMIKDSSLSSTIRAMSELKVFVQEWINLSDLTFRVFPLEYEYTERNLSFPGLKGNDSKLAKLFLDVSELEVFLTIICRHDEGRPNEDEVELDKGYGGAIECYVSNCEMEEVYSTSYRVEFGIDRYGHKVSIPLDIDLDRDLVGDVEGLYEEMLPTNQECSYTGNEGMDLESWYHSAFLVTTPRELYFKMLVRTNLSSSLSYLESAVKHVQQLNKEGNWTMIKRFLNIVLSSGENLAVESERVIKLCNALGQETQEVYKLILSNTRTLNDLNAVTNLISMQQHISCDDWYSHVQTVVLETNIQPRPTYLCYLISLLIKTAKDPEKVYSLGMKFISLVLPETLNFSILNWATSDLVNLTKVLFYLNQSIYLTRLYEILVTKGNELKKDAALHRLLDSNLFWNEVFVWKMRLPFHVGAEMKWLSELVARRIEKINTIPPVSMNTWAFPEASIPQHLELQQFLRSEEKSKVFTGFHGIHRARNFKMAYFGYGYGLNVPKNYSANAQESGKGIAAKVTVTKTKDYYRTKNEFYLEMKRFVHYLNGKLRDLGLALPSSPYAILTPSSITPTFISSTTSTTTRNRPALNPKTVIDLTNL